jgi:hypothetical protein
MKYIEHKSYKGRTEISICQTEIEHPQARLASELMRHLAIVAAVPDGVDEAGRQKLRLMTEPEVVERATKIADLAWTEYRKRNWLLDVPLPKVGEDV